MCEITALVKLFLTFPLIMFFAVSAMAILGSSCEPRFRGQSIITNIIKSSLEVGEYSLRIGRFEDAEYNFSKAEQYARDYGIDPLVAKAVDGLARAREEHMREQKKFSAKSS